MKLMAVALLLLAGCAGPNPSYIQADRATYEAIAPEYLRYIQDDARLTGAEVQRRIDTVNTWLRRIEAAEANR